MKEDPSSDERHITDDDKELTMTVDSRTRNPLDNHLVRSFKLILVKQVILTFVCLHLQTLISLYLFLCCSWLFLNLISGIDIKFN